MAQGSARAKKMGFKWFHLVTVTSHAALPREAILAQLSDVADLNQSRIGWLNWRTVARFLSGLESDHSLLAFRGWFVDLAQVLQAVGQGPFVGYKDLSAAAEELIDSISEVNFWGKRESSHIGFKELDLAAAELQSLPLD